MIANAITIEPLTQEGFRPFGQVIETANAEIFLINEGTAQRFHNLANVDVSAEGGQPIISLFRSSARSRPIPIRMMERHPLGSQAFFPLSQNSWLIIVAEGTGAPDLSTIRCFQAQADQGINFNRGVWHHPLFVFDTTQDFIVFDRGGDGENLEEHWWEEDAAYFVE